MGHGYSIILHILYIICELLTTEMGRTTPARSARKYDFNESNLYTTKGAYRSFNSSFNGPFAVLISYLAELHRTELRARVILLTSLFYTLANITLPLLAWGLLINDWELHLLTDVFGKLDANYNSSVGLMVKI